MDKVLLLKVNILVHLIRNNEDLHSIKVYIYMVQAYHVY